MEVGGQESLQQQPVGPFPSFTGRAYWIKDFHGLWHYFGPMAVPALCLGSARLDHHQVGPSLCGTSFLAILCYHSLWLWVFPGCQALCHHISSQPAVFTITGMGSQWLIMFRTSALCPGPHLTPI